MARDKVEFYFKYCLCNIIVLNDISPTVDKNITQADFQGNMVFQRALLGAGLEIIGWKNLGKTVKFGL